MWYKFLAFWNKLSSQKKKLLVVSTLGILLLFITIYGYNVRQQNRVVNEPKKSTFQLEPGAKTLENTWMNTAQKDMSTMKKEIEMLKVENERLKNDKRSPQQIQSQTNTQQESQINQPKGKLVDEINQALSKNDGDVNMKIDAPVQSQQTFQNTPPVPENKLDTGVTLPQLLDRKEKATGLVPNRPLPSANTAPQTPQQASNSGVTQTNNGMGMSIVEFKVPVPKETQKQSNGTKQPVAFYVPTSTITHGMLLTGMEAPTLQKARQNPHPIIIRLQDISFLPNEVKQDWEGCFLLGEGYGEVSSERAYIRLQKLSCVDKNTKEATDISVKGYIADSDGKNGLRGKVVAKTGAFLARALMLAFIEGVSKGFNQSSTNVILSGSGVVQTTDPVDNFGEGFKRGAFSGASKAADKLSDFYMKMAEEIYPVVEIGAQRNVTVIFTDGFTVKFDKKLSTKENEEL